MQGLFAVLPPKSDIYCVLNIMNIHNISLNSQGKVLCLNTNYILGDRGIFLLEGREMEKLLFNLHFLDQDISVNNELRCTKS